MSAYQSDRIINETFVDQIDFHMELESTNNRALELARDPSLANNVLVLTEHQTQGRGRGDNQWYSTGGSVTFSVLVPLGDLPGDRIPQLSLTVGLALCRAVEGIAPSADVALKWPNDVYLNERKLAGILIELPPAAPPRAVIGVGFNLNNSLQQAPAEVIESAISLRDCLGIEIDPTELLIRCLQTLEQQLQAFRDPAIKLADQWRAYHLLEHRQVEMQVYSRTVSGVCAGIDEDGALLLETSEGTERFLGGIVTRFA